MVAFLTSFGNRSLCRDSKTKRLVPRYIWRLDAKRRAESRFHEQPLVLPQLTHL